VHYQLQLFLIQPMYILAMAVLQSYYMEKAQITFGQYYQLMIFSPVVPSQGFRTICSFILDKSKKTCANGPKGHDSQSTADPVYEKFISHRYCANTFLCWEYFQSMPSARFLHNQGFFNLKYNHLCPVTNL
jgi:hypothetical protein